MVGGAGSGQAETGQAFSLKLVRGGRVVGRRPPGFTAEARDFEPKINQGAYLYLVAKKVVGYGLGSWMVLVSVLTVLVKTDEDARARMEDEHPLLLAVCDYYASMFDRILADDGEDEGEQEAEDDGEDDDGKFVCVYVRQIFTHIMKHHTRNTNKNRTSYANDRRAPAAADTRGNTAADTCFCVCRRGRGRRRR